MNAVLKANEVLVLNVDMSILGTTTWKRAARLIAKGKAEVLSEGDWKIHATQYVPLAIRLIKAIRNLWRTCVPWSKSNIHERDLYTCQYCGKKLRKNKATIDHVIPRDKGGKNSWVNCVTACFPCNNIKSNRTPSEARMHLIKGQPHQPTIMEFIQKKIKVRGLEGVAKDLGIW